MLSSPANGQQPWGGCCLGEQHVLAGICSLPGDAFGQKGRARARGGEIPTAGCLEVWVRVGTSMFFWQSPSVMLPAIAREMISLVVWVLPKGQED